MYIATKNVNSSGALARETGVEPEIAYGAPLKIIAVSWLPAKRPIGKPIAMAHTGNGSDGPEFAASTWSCGGSRSCNGSISEIKSCPNSLPSSRS
jgi:hypothetical protein